MRFNQWHHLRHSLERSAGVHGVCILTTNFLEFEKENNSANSIKFICSEIHADHVDVDKEKTFVDIHEHNAEYFLVCKNGQIYK